MAEQQPHTNQPAAKPPMKSDIAKDVGTTFLKSAAKESGKQAVDYEKDHGQEQFAEARQKMDQAKAEAQGMLSKFCPCFGG